MTGPLIPKGAEGANPGEELAEAPAGEAAAGAAPPPSLVSASVAGQDDDAGEPVGGPELITPIRPPEAAREAPVAAVASLAAATPEVPELTLLCRALALLSLVGWSVGMVLGLLAIKGNTEPFLLSNFFGNTGRMFLLGVMAGCAGITALASLLYYRKIRANGGAERLFQIAKRVSPVALVGFVPFLFRWRTWNGRDFTFLFMVAIFSLCARTAMRACLSSPPIFTGPRALAWRRSMEPLRAIFAGRRWVRLPLVIVVVASAAYAALFATYTITFHHNLRTAAYDLGLEDNLVYNVLHGIGFFRSTPFSGPTGSHFGNHATFFSYVIAPFYALSQGAATLLFIQSLMIGVAAIPLFLVARRHLGAWSGCLIALCYLLYPPNHGANLYEFHYIPFGAFFLWTTLYLFETHHDRWGIVFTILALSVREDIGGAGVATLGAFLLMSGERPRVGLALAIVGGLHFCLLKMVFMPLVLGGESFITFYKDLEPVGQQNFGGVVKTVFGNPFYTLHTLLEREKLLYMLQYFVPLAFIPLKRPIVLLLIVPGFFFTVLSTGYMPLIQTSFQYTFYWTVFLMIGLIYVLDRKSSPRLSDSEYLVNKRAALFALVCAMVPVSYQSGAIFQRNTARGGFSLYNFQTTERDLNDRKTFAEIVKLIPPRATVSASDNLVPQISNRPVAYTLRFSVFDAEYILFFSDPSRIDGSERQKVTDALISGEFGVVDMKPPFAVAKRGYSTAQNDRVLATWGLRMAHAAPSAAPAPPP